MTSTPWIAESPIPMAPLVALVGPTASGKSAAALAAAEALRRQHGVAVELISVDSALVYRGMDIGTAKPRATERAAVPHHLIDILDPAQRYSAADFVADVHRLAGDIHSRGAWPLLVGGTMLYIKALAEGLDPLPPADAAVRAELDAWAAREGWPALHAALREVDPITADRLAPNDAQRLQRAWEVWRVSGQPLSAWHSGLASPIGVTAQSPSSDPSQGPSPTQADDKPSPDLTNDASLGAWPGASSGASTVALPGVLLGASSGASPGASTGASSGATSGERPPRAGAWPLALISLEPDNRAWLHARIAQRFDTMLAEGFLAEVRRLRRRPDLNPQLPSIRCVGYRQAWAMFDALANAQPEPADCDDRDALDPPAPALAAFREAGIAATRQLAKRQLTWLRSMPQREIIACDHPDAQAQAVEKVVAAWRRQPPR